MKFLDRIIPEFEKEIRHLEERIASGIAYDFNKQLPIWEDERNFLKALLLNIQRSNSDLDCVSETEKDISLTHEMLEANKIKKGCGNKLRPIFNDSWLCGFNGNLCKGCQNKLDALVSGDEQ